MIRWKTTDEEDYENASPKEHCDAVASEKFNADEKPMFRTMKHQ